MTTDTIFFDLDNTILDFSRAERVALERALSELGLEPAEEVCRRYSVLNLAQWKLLEKGVLTREEVKLRRFRLLFEELGTELPPEKAAARYEEYLGIGHYFIEGAEELLEELSGAYRLYLVTNGTAKVQKSRIASADLQRWFQGIFISEEIGWNKPDRRYFESCFARIPSFSRERAVIVGDSLTSDIQGGAGAGIRTVWFCPESAEPDGAAAEGTMTGDAGGIRPDRVIRQLDELPALLKHW